MRTFSLVVLLPLSVAATSPIVAQTERDLGSHAHGAASMNVAIDENLVFIELETPWDNLVGFEHYPSTDEQKKSVQNALKSLNNPQSLFTFIGQNCSPVETFIESTLDDKHDEHDEHDEHEEHEEHDEHDEHEEHEKHDEHDEHDEHHQHSDSESSSHAEVLASYTFECQSVSDLDAIDVKLFDTWSGFESISVQLLGPKGQSGSELSTNQSQLDLSSIL